MKGSDQVRLSSGCRVEHCNVGTAVGCEDGVLVDGWWVGCKVGPGVTQYVGSDRRLQATLHRSRNAGWLAHCAVSPGASNPPQGVSGSGVQSTDGDVDGEEDGIAVGRVVGVAVVG